nr:two-component response regulator-like PRR73 [Ipomoea trifida]
MRQMKRYRLTMRMLTSQKLMKICTRTGVREIDWKLELNKTQKNELKDMDNGHVAAITIKHNLLLGITAKDVPTDPSKMTNTKEIAPYNTKEMPSLELSLKQHIEVGEIGTTVNLAPRRRTLPLGDEVSVSTPVAEEGASTRCRGVDLGTKCRGRDVGEGGDNAVDEATPFYLLSLWSRCGTSATVLEARGLSHGRGDDLGPNWPR